VYTPSAQLVHWQRQRHGQLGHLNIDCHVYSASLVTTTSHKSFSVSYFCTSAVSCSFENEFQVSTIGHNTMTVTVTERSPDQLSPEREKLTKPKLELLASAGLAPSLLLFECSGCGSSILLYSQL
jgi:hypothetical protein